MNLKKIGFQLIVLIFVTIGGSIAFNYQSLLAHPLESNAEIKINKHQPTYPICSKHNPNVWHPTVEKDPFGNILCVYGHEHGDQPPDWIFPIESNLGFDHQSGFMANTSPLENSLKHSGMKGFSTTIKNVQIYARIHLASNPLDRASRFHSYQLFLKDPSGGISHFQGWLDSGDPQFSRIPYRDSSLGEKGKDPGIRPIVWASTRHACIIDQTWCIELWSMKTSPWGPDIIWGINDATTFYHPDEQNTADINQWDKSGLTGMDRSLTVTIYRQAEDLKKRGINSLLTGTIWATQFGEIVTDSSDKKCFEKTIKSNVEYQNICLKNYIAPSLPQITGVGNTAQKYFDNTGVILPN